jgi:hypothetical protein
MGESPRTTGNGEVPDAQASGGLTEQVRAQNRNLRVSDAVGGRTGKFDGTNAQRSPSQTLIIGMTRSFGAGQRFSEEDETVFR